MMPASRGVNGVDGVNGVNGHDRLPDLQTFRRMVVESMMPAHRRYV